MSEAAARGQSTTDEGGAKSVGGGLPPGSLVAVVLFVCATPVAFFAIRSLWDILIRSLLHGQRFGPDAVHIVAATPWSVLVAQFALATFVGLLLGFEWLAYSTRRELLPAGWWVGGPLSRGMRVILAVAGFALFPVGVALGLAFVVPLVGTVLGATGGTVSVLRVSILIALATIATGVAVQTVYVGGMVALSRLRPSADARSGDD